ncbi:MAG: hypothetical protein KGS48_00370 [Bacteroidetes bacterium]|nr:hypothetical protein [Bacteroidota bacterium]
MKLILFLPAIGLMFSSIPTDHPIQPVAGIAQVVPAAVFLASNTRPHMWTNQHSISKGEGFDLHFRAPNPDYLGVLDPRGKFFYLVYPSAAVVGDLQPLVASKDFIQLTKLHINTRTLSGDPYEYGVYENQPVFTRSGVYRFVLGENLHVDTEEGLCILKIRYSHKRKTVRSVKTDQSIASVLP